MKLSKIYPHKIPKSHNCLVKKDKIRICIGKEISDECLSCLDPEQRKKEYLLKIYEKIMPNMRIPENSKNKSAALTKGVIAFHIDSGGQLIKQLIYKSSGDEDLDKAALLAVTKSAPFLAPPADIPYALLFSYSTK